MNLTTPRKWLFQNKSELGRDSGFCFDGLCVCALAPDVSRWHQSCTGSAGPQPDLFTFLAYSFNWSIHLQFQKKTNPIPQTPRQCIITRKLGYIHSIMLTDSHLIWVWDISSQLASNSTFWNNAIVHSSDLATVWEKHWSTKKTIYKQKVHCTMHYILHKYRY